MFNATFGGFKQAAEIYHNHLRRLSFIYHVAQEN